MWWVFFSILSSCATAIATVLTKLGLNYLDPVVITALQTFTTSLVLILVAFYAKSSWSFYGSMNSTLIISMGLLTNMFAYLFFAYALKHGPVIPVSAIYLLNLPLTLFICALTLNEVVSAKLLIGTGLMLAGAVMLTVG
jgi:uncharacterized membrane protein